MALRAYMAFRRWIDRDLSRGWRVGHPYNSERPGLCFMLPAALGGLGALILGTPVDRDVAVWRTEQVLGTAASALSVALFGFMGWRLLRLMWARSIKEGRFYERKGRRALPPEYADSEDALLAARRRAH
jgi:hypothetical protein